MLGFFGRFKTLLLVIGFLCLPVALLYVQRRIPAVREFSAGLVIDSTHWLQSVVVSSFGSLADRYDRYFNALDSYDELKRLQRSVEKMRALRIALVEVQMENERLKRLLKFHSTFEGTDEIGARIIGRTGAPLAKTIQIDKGRRDGVRRGDGVVGPDGVIGQVIATGLYSSEVLLVSDSSSAIDVIVERTRAQGMLRGSSSERGYLMRVNDFDRLHEVAIGDVVVTSGVGARFPFGTPVGQVVSKRISSSGLYIEAEVKPYSELGHIEEVMVFKQGKNGVNWRRRSGAVELLQQCVMAK